MHLVIKHFLPVEIYRCIHLIAHDYDITLLSLSHGNGALVVTLNQKVLMYVCALIRILLLC